jgi:nucleotide-binding universal stress UspA family protein
VHIVNELILGYTYSTAEYSAVVIDSMREMGKTVLADAVAEAKKHGVQAQAELLEMIGGHAADLIVKHAKQIDAEIIVMGTHGRRGLRRLALGSDAEQVVRLAEIPVLLVRGDTSVAGEPLATARIASEDLRPRAQEARRGQ